MIVRECLERITAQLTQSDLFHGHGIDNAWDEAVALVCHVLHLPIDCDDSVLQHTVSNVQWQRMEHLTKRRIDERVPIFYLTQQAWFMGLPFYVDERVLIPRSPFAEWIEKRFEPWVDPHQVQHILEIGTGSGCMAIAAAYVFPDAAIDAVDISEGALAVAKQNVEQHVMTDSVRLLRSNCFRNLDADKQYDLIISNPPYVAQEEIDELPPEYRHEPIETALYAADEGMAIVDEIIREAPKHMTPNAVLVIEVGYSDEILLSRYPHVPFTWLECEYGGQGLFLLTKEQLESIDVRK